MKAEYSAHPALATKQLQRAANAHQKNHNHQSSHRRNVFGKSSHSTAAVAAAAGAHHSCCVNSTKKSSTHKTASAGAALTTDTTLPKLPDRTDAAAARAADVTASAPPLEDDEGDDDDDIVHSADCDVTATIENVAASVDDIDHVYHRFCRTAATARSKQQQQQNATSSISTSSTNNYHCSQVHHHHHQTHQHFSCSVAATPSCDGAAGGDYGVSSGFSSADSSPSTSTTSSPLSTPTRLVVPHCCQQPKTSADAGSGASTSNPSTAEAHHTHQHHHPHVHPTAGCKKLQKFDPRLGPSPYRQLLPIALCILSFATVFSILIVYMDTTEIRHQQFRLNMSRDYEMYGVPQDDPELIAFLREIQMKKYPMHFLKNRDPSDHQSPSSQQSRLNFSAHPGELTPEMAHYVSNLVGGKVNGSVIQSLPGAMGEMMTAPWLAGTLNWAGVIVEPEPRRYFALRKQNARHSKLQVVHACVSQNAHPKEVTIHNEEAEVRINSLLDEETSWFFSRLKCFPLYTIMLACNRVEYDLLSLGVRGHELEILQTLPFDKIQIEVISIHLPDDHENIRAYVQSVTKFLKGKSYRLQKNFARNYFYQKINSTNRTRKKDILLMKQTQQP